MSKQPFQPLHYALLVRDAMGAKIIGAGSPSITITGVKALHGAEHDERRAGDLPEAFPIGTQRRGDHVAHAQAAARFHCRSQAAPHEVPLLRSPQVERRALLMCGSVRAHLRWACSRSHPRRGR